MLRDFDELSVLGKFQSTYSKKFDYDEYFSTMDVSDAEKEKVKSFAEKIERIFMVMFALYAISEKNSEEIFSIAYQLYIEQMKDFIGIKENTAYIEEHARKIILEVIDTTSNNVNDEDITSNNENQKESDSFFLSDKRAKAIAASEAVMGLNYSEYVKAVNSGMTQKTWVSEKDKRVRRTHQEVDESTINIFKPFVVGNSELMFPKDTSLGASNDETANCRCTVKYSKDDK